MGTIEYHFFDGEHFVGDIIDGQPCGNVTYTFISGQTVVVSWTHAPGTNVKAFAAYARTAAHHQSIKP